MHVRRRCPPSWEMLRIPYTGSRVMTLALALDKPATKRAHLSRPPTPAFQVFERVAGAARRRCNSRSSSSPAARGRAWASAPIQSSTTRHNCVANWSASSSAINNRRWLSDTSKVARVTMGLVGNLVSPAARRMPEDENAPRIFKGLHISRRWKWTWASIPSRKRASTPTASRSSWLRISHYLCPAPLPETLVEDLRWYTAAVFRVTGCMDVARVDFRLDMHDNNKPYILEVNPLPGLNAGYSDLCIEAAAAGWTYEGLINRILDEAAGRYGLKRAKGRRHAHPGSTWAAPTRMPC